MAKKAVKQVNIAMPEFIVREEYANDTWSVEKGSPVRGQAWAELDARRLRVPYGEDAASRIIRAHELMHVRVSPLDTANAVQSFDDVSADSVIAAEEFRVNTLLQRAGFNTDDLRDGSESTAGERLTQRGDWNEAVRFMGATAGTKAGADFLRGVKKVDPEWAKALGEIQKAMKKAVRKVGTKSLGSVSLDEQGRPSGFVNYTQALARIIQIASDAGNPDPDTGEEKEIDAEEIKTKVGNRNTRIAGTGRFAAPIIDPIPLTRRVAGQMGRKRVATNVGRNPRRINRMLVDPERRVFDRKIKGKGGVVLIDQSGSMHLDDDDLWAILSAAPGCTVIGYSHKPGSSDGTPNIWVLAQDGKVCGAIRRGNGGNGVDGPALELGIKKRKSKTDPFIWVCDGLVTDERDQSNEGLSEVCAKIVVKEKIHMVNTPAEAVNALQDVKSGKRLGVTATGLLSRTEAWRNR
jgi:hypothetical protein